MSYFPNNSVSTIGTILPIYANLIGGSDGTNLRAFATDSTGQVKVLIQNSPAVTVSNFPGTQPISGTVTVNTLPAGTNVIGHVIVDSGAVSVSNFPATQPVSIASSVAVTGTFFQTTQPVSIATAVAVTGTFWQATQPVSGTVGVSGSVAVTGTFWQATQPVSGTVTTTPPNHASTNIDQIGGSGLTLGQKVMASSIPVVISSDQGAITITGSISASNPSVSSTGSSIPTSSTLIGGTDGTLLRGILTDTSGQVKVLVENSVAVTGTFWQTTQPISGTVTANIGTSGSLALDATLTGGTQKTKLIDTGGTNVASISAGGALKVDGSGVTQPVSLASSVAVTGTFFQTTQPVSLTSTTITGSVAVTGTFFQATQPVSGTVTANAGTGTFATQDVSTVAQGSTTSGQSGTIVQGATTTSAPTYVTTKTNPLSLDTSGNLRTSVNNTVAVTGTFFQSTQPVSIAASVAVTGTFFQATQPVSGTVTANAGTGNFSTNIAQVNGSTASTAATGVLKVGIVGNAGAAFDSATAATAPANAIQQGLVAATAYPTAVTGGQLIGAMADKAGRQSVVLNSPRDLIGHASLQSNSSGTATSFIAAGGTGIFNDIITLVITNESGTATIVTLSDNGAAGNLYSFALAANGGIVINFPTPLPQGTSNVAWEVLNTAAVSLDYMVVFAKNK